MRKLDFNEFKTCQMIASLFESSIEKANFSSPMFIRRFVSSDFASLFESKRYLTSTFSIDDIICELNTKYQASTKKPMYSKDQMYWIGYVYLAIAFLYELSFKQLYKIFPPKEIVKYYYIYHTFDIEEAAERMMESKGYEPFDFVQRGVEILKRLYLMDALKSMIKKRTHFYLKDLSKINFTKNDNIKYSIKEGYVTNAKELNNSFQKVYTLGVDESCDEFYGTVIGVITNKKNKDNGLIVVSDGINLDEKEIDDVIKVIEENSSYKVIEKEQK